MIVVLEDYGEYDGEGFYGIFSSVEKILAELKLDYMGEYEFEHKPESHEIVMYRSKQVKEICSRWNLYYPEMDRPFNL